MRVPEPVTCLFEVPVTIAVQSSFRHLFPLHTVNFTPEDHLLPVGVSPENGAPLVHDLHMKK